MYIGLHAKYPFLLLDFNETRIFSTAKNPQISNFMIICPLGVELFYADKRMDRNGETNSRFSKFYERA